MINLFFCKQEHMSVVGHAHIKHTNCMTQRQAKWSTTNILYWVKKMFWTYKLNYWTIFGQLCVRAYKPSQVGCTTKQTVFQTHWLSEIVFRPQGSLVHYRLKLHINSSSHFLSASLLTDCVYISRMCLKPPQLLPLTKTNYMVLKSYIIVHLPCFLCFGRFT